MRNIRKETAGMIFAAVVFAVCLLLIPSTREVQAATGFQKVADKTYYYTSSGEKYTGWLTLAGRKYYFYPKTGEMATGWVTNSAGQKRYFNVNTGAMLTGWATTSAGQKRYFNPSNGILLTGWYVNSAGNYRYFSNVSGYMATGWVTNSSGKKRYFSTATGYMATGWVENSIMSRYFDPSTGYLYTGLQTVDNSLYYFSSATGARTEGRFLTVSGSTYYFGEDGKAQTGWLVLSGKRYWFNSAGVMYANRTATIGGKNYYFAEDGVATEVTYTVSGNNVKVYENGRTYTLVKEFLTHPGIADESVSDLDLLAALCECEAGGQGLVGMEAVALTILNRTIKADKEFPSTLRYVIYQGTSFAQYSPVTNGSLLKRLNGNFENRALAYQAAQKAMDIFNAYVTKGTKRTLPGFTTKDFNYLYFMTDTAFWRQNLNFSKVEYYTYSANGGTHVFFVDWI